MDVLYDLLDSCTVTIWEKEINYKPIGGPPDAYVHDKLNISQLGACIFHVALRRPGEPQTKGYV